MRCVLLALSLLLTWNVTSASAQDRFLGKTANEWTQLLKHSANVNQRRNAAFALGKMGNRAFFVIPQIKVACAQEKDPKVKESILYALGEICRDSKALGKDDDLSRILLAALKDSDRLVRRSAAFALGCQGSTADAVRQGLDGALRDKEPIVRQNATWALGQFGEKALPSLQKALHDDDSFVKRDAATALLQVEDAEKVHDLVKDVAALCNDKNSEVRRAALNVLVRVVDPRDKDLIAPLRIALDDRDLENKRNAALTLSNIGGKDTVVALPVLLEAIQNGDLDVRKQAALAIRNIGPAAAEAVPELLRLLREDKDQEVRRNAALALGGIGKNAEAAVIPLMEKLKSPTEAAETRIECGIALKNIGNVPTADKIMPDLVQLLSNPREDGEVRDKAIWAMQVHGIPKLRTMDAPKQALTVVLKEAPNPNNRMLRYNCAYMLGMIWREDAPDAALDVLNEFMRDASVKLFEGQSTGVGGAGVEFGGGQGTVKVRGVGDGRTMAAEALKLIGPERYGKHAELMKQLNHLVSDNATLPALRKKAEELVKAVR